MELDKTPNFPDGALTSNRKADAIQLLGDGSAAQAARSLGYTTRQSMYQWPDTLDSQRIDQVNGALLRLGRISALRKKTEVGEGA
jgi:hypothetical protein